MFNRRHYEFVANVIKEQRTENTGHQLEDHRNNALDSLAWKFADAFAADNSAFDADRFFNATVDGVVKRLRKTAEG